MVDVTEILQHWYAGRPKVEVARSLGVDAKTVRRYVAAAEAAGMAPGGPPVTEEQWRALARGWFPQIAGTGIRQVSWRQIAVHHDRIAELLGVVPVSVIHQRLADEQGLEASVASVRRYVRAHFPDRRGLEVRMHRPPSAPGAEALCGKPHRASLGSPFNRSKSAADTTEPAGQAGSRPRHADSRGRALTCAAPVKWRPRTSQMPGSPLLRKPQ